MSDPRANDRPFFHTDLRVLIRWHVHLCTAEVEEAAFNSLLAVLRSSGDGPDGWFKEEYGTLVELYAGKDGKPRRQMLEGEWADADAATAGRGKYVPFRKEVFRRLDEHSAVIAHRASLGSTRTGAEEAVKEAAAAGEKVDWSSEAAKELMAPCRVIVADHLLGRYCKDLEREEAQQEAQEATMGPLQSLIARSGVDGWRQAERMLFVRQFNPVCEDLRDRLLHALKELRAGVAAEKLEDEASDLTLQFLSHQLAGDRFLWYECESSSLTGWSRGRADRFVKDCIRRWSNGIGGDPDGDDGDGLAGGRVSAAPVHDVDLLGAVDWLGNALAMLPLRQRQAVLGELIARRIGGGERDGTKQYVAAVLGQTPRRLSRNLATTVQNLVQMVRDGRLESPFSDDRVLTEGDGETADEEEGT